MQPCDLYTERTGPVEEGAAGTRWAAAQVPPLWRAGVPLWARRGAAVLAREKGEGSLWGPPPHKGRSEECGGGALTRAQLRTQDASSGPPSGPPLARGETPGTLSLVLEPD